MIEAYSLGRNSVIPQLQGCHIFHERKAQILNIEKALKKIEFIRGSWIHSYSTTDEMLTNFKNSIQSLRKNSEDE